MASRVQIVDVWKKLGQHQALRSVSLDVPDGGVVCVIGPSGAGKSTLLRCVNHLERPDRGFVLVGGKPVGFVYRLGALHECSEAALSEVRAGIGMVFQRFNVFKHMSALENVTFAQCLVRRRTKQAARERAQRSLESVGLGDKGHRYPSELSGGEQQRVAIARALAMDPAVMLFDEPTSALDAELVGEVLEVMRRLADEGMTMLIATHELHFARDVADRIAFMDGGEILELGPPDQVLAHPEHLRTKTFLRRVNA
jgi:polar amino acid transport system ATP-binding protein